MRRFDARTGVLKSVRQLPGAGTFSSFWNWLSPRGTLLLTAGIDGPGNYHLDLWDLEKGKIRQMLPLAGLTPWGAAISTDGRRVAVAGSLNGQTHRVLVWDLETSRSRLLWSETKVYNAHYFEPVVILSPDGKRLLACHLDQILRCWEVESGKLLWQSEKKCWQPFIFFSPDGRTVVDPTSIGIAGLRLRDAATGKLLEAWNKPPKEAITPIGFSPDGRFLVFQTDHEEVVLWEPGKDKVAFRSPRTPHCRGDERSQPNRLPTNFVFTPDGKALIRRAGALQRWNLPGGEPVYQDTESWGHTEEVGRLLFSPDGRLLASSSRDEMVRLWDVATARTVHSLPKGLSDHLAFTPDGRRLLSVPPGLGKTVLQVTDVATGQLTTGFELADNREFRPSSRDREIRVTADGKKVIVLTMKNGKTGDESILTAWDITTGACLVHKRVPWGEDSLLTPDGQSVLMLDSTARAVKLLAVDTGERRWQMQPDPSRDKLRGWGCDLALSPNGRLMAAHIRYLNLLNLHTEYDAICLGDMANGRELLKIPLDGPAVFDFSADNRLFAVADSDRVRFWETASWHAIGALKVQSGASNPPDRACARSLAFSPDGHIFATGHADGTILLWDATLRGGTHGGPLETAQREALWKDLAGEHAGHAYAAIWRLADDPASAAFLKDRLKAVVPPSPELLRSLLDDLDSDQFAVREAAEQKLRELGERAGSALRESLRAKPSLEKRRRIEALLNRLEGSGPFSGEPLRQMRAVQVLEKIGSAEARTVLEGLTRGVDSARLTREAKAALGRMRR